MSDTATEEQKQADRKRTGAFVSHWLFSYAKTLMLEHKMTYQVGIALRNTYMNNTKQLTCQDIISRGMQEGKEKCLTGTLLL